MVKCKLISDLHIGSRFSRMDLIEEAFKGNNPILLGGDMCDWINTKDPRHDSDCIMTIDEQITALLKILKGKNIISMIDGNHENSINRYTGVNTLKLVSEQLNIPYNEQNVYVEIDDKIIYNYHGVGGGAFKGTILQKLEKTPMHRSADVYVQGHSHQLFCCPTMVEYRGKLVMNWLVNSGSFLADATYARSKNLSPSIIGYAIYDTEKNYAYPVLFDERKEVPKTIYNIDKRGLYDYYKNHSLKETTDYFDVSERTICRRLKEYGISKRKM